MMFPSSLAVIVVGLLLGRIALAALTWVWRHGQFDALDQQQRVLFAARDYLLFGLYHTLVRLREHR